MDLLSGRMNSRRLKRAAGGDVFNAKRKRWNAPNSRSAAPMSDL
jgi:hypothetical protein